MTLFSDTVVDPGRVIGSPLYSTLPEHAPALIAAALVPAGMWFVGRMASRGRPGPLRLVRGYQALPSSRRFLVWMLALTASIHAGLVVGHEPSFESLLFLADAVALFAVGRALVVGARWRLPAAIVLPASILAYAVASFGGSAPDQVGLATKLVELAALTIVLTPQRDRRLRRLAGSVAIVSLVLVTGMSAWAGAFIAAAGEGGRGAHGSGAAPAPGSVIRVGIERDATPEERAATDEFYATAVAALAKYGDPSVAAADGYLVEGLAGTDFHAANPAYAADGRILDPARPEALVFAATSSGPALLGAMYEMPSLTEPGPRIGGPLTEWHGHENVCFSIAPPALTGLVSPFGFCPVGSITFPTTSEMIHIWTAPGVPQWFGDLDPEWLAVYLASFDRQT